MADSPPHPETPGSHPGDDAPGEGTGAVGTGGDPAGGDGVGDDRPREGDSGLFERLRADLDEERQHLDNQLHELGEDGEGPAFDEGFADSAQVTAEQVESRTLAARLRDQLDDVEAALDRLDAGTYGRCEQCGEPIAAARLEAIPTARWCIDHAG